MDNYFSNKKIFITGASSGIGEALALLLAGKGTSLALCARRENLLRELQDSCSDLGADVLIFQADVRVYSEMKDACDQINEKWGCADIVIANAGVGKFNPGARFSMKRHLSIMETNLNGMVNTIMPFVPAMIRRQEGHIIGISSLAGVRGLPANGSYCASKAAQTVFLESLGIDLKPYKIKVTCIQPGFVDTPMTNSHKFRMPFLMTAKDAAEKIAYAASRGKSFYAFPLPMKIISLINRMTPVFIHEKIMMKIKRDLKI